MNVPEYYIPPIVTYYGRYGQPTAPTLNYGSSDFTRTANKVVYGAIAVTVLSRALYRAYHSIPSDRKGGNDYRIYSLYPFFREKSFFKKNKL